MRALLCLVLLVATFSVDALRSEQQISVPTVFSGRHEIPGWKTLSRSTTTKSIQQQLKRQEQEREIHLLLRRSNSAELEELFWQLSDPQHHSYGDHLSSDQMVQLISPQGDEALRTITTWLKETAKVSQDKIKMSAHKDLVKFSATWDQLEGLFPGLEDRLTVVQSTTSGHLALVAALGGFVILPETVGKFVELVGGLAEFPAHDDLEENFRRKRNSDEVFSSPSSEGLLTPQDIWDQYNLTKHMNQPASLPGGPQSNTQAFLQLGEGTNVTDLSYFCDYFKVSQAGQKGGDSCTVEKFVNGDPLIPSSVRLESDMDAQLLVGVGQRPTWVYTYKGSQPCSRWAQFAVDIFNQTNESESPRVITISYGIQSYPTWCDNAVTRFSEDIKKFGVMGISVLSGSGDVGSGSHSRLGSNHGHLSPGFPSQIPYMTAVGATDLKKSDGGDESSRPFSERAASFSGGGFSWNYSMPDYQTAAVSSYMSLKNISWPDKSKATWNYHSNGVKGRATPDVTACGSNLAIYVSGFGGWIAGMGTSASGPIVGGLVSQLNNVRLATANKTMGFINPFFYQNADCFYDITVGDTDGGGAGVFPGLGWHAAPGWDATSGLGALNFECLRDRVLKMKR